MNLTHIMLEYTAESPRRNTCVSPGFKPTTFTAADVSMLLINDYFTANGGVVLVSQYLETHNCSFYCSLTIYQPLIKLVVPTFKKNTFINALLERFKEITPEQIYYSHYLTVAMVSPASPVFISSI